MNPTCLVSDPGFNYLSNAISWFKNFRLYHVTLFLFWKYQCTINEWFCCNIGLQLSCFSLWFIIYMFEYWFVLIGNRHWYILKLGSLFLLYLKSVQFSLDFKLIGIIFYAIKYFLGVVRNHVILVCLNILKCFFLFFFIL